MVRRTMLVALVAASAVVVLACGSDTKNDKSRAGGGSALRVTARSIAFVPENLEATKGEPATVTFKNADGLAHTFTVYRDEDFKTRVAGADSGNVGQDETKDVAIPVVDNDLYFRCEIHPTQMMGEIKAK